MPLIQDSVRSSCCMFQAEVNKNGVGLLTVSFAQHVDANEMNCCLTRVRLLLEDLKPGFKLLTNLSGLDSMDVDCAPNLGEMMDLCNRMGIRSVSRVVPDPSKDIGFYLMSSFHYGRDVRTTTHDNLDDAMHNLEVDGSSTDSNTGR